MAEIVVGGAIAKLSLQIGRARAVFDLDRGEAQREITFTAGAFAERTDTRGDRVFDPLQLLRLELLDHPVAPVGDVLRADAGEIRDLAIGPRAELLGDVKKELHQLA